MRIYICDDDIFMIEMLEKYLQSYFESNHLSIPQFVSYTNGEALLADPQPKDIVFLDIEMPGINGIHVGRELKKQNRNCIIFIVTSYSDYLDEAMRFHVFRYLSKPLDQQRLFRNMRDALTYYSALTAQIAVETKDGIYTIPTFQLLAVEARGKKVIVHTVNQDLYSVKTIDYWLEQLPRNSFFQSHRSYIVNLAHITEFNHSMIHLGKHQLTAYLTRRKYTAFKNAYLMYLESMR